MKEVSIVSIGEHIVHITVSIIKKELVLVTKQA